MRMSEEEERAAIKANQALNLIMKWRSWFTGWQLGTRLKGDPESDALRHHRELSILLRVEVTALAGLLIKKEVFSALEWTLQLAEEAEALELAYEKAYPGVSALPNGLNYKLPEAAETMKRMNFKP
jgi:hypothetical protein